jgi:flagellar basal-body rod protein FlgB
MNALFASPTITALKVSMDAGAIRHKFLANNIANAETPGFKRSDVKFESYLAEALGRATRTNISEQERRLEVAKMAELKPSVYLDLESPARQDGNNVTMDKEMAIMSDNAIHYSIYSELIKRMYNGLSMAIRGRG